MIRSALVACVVAAVVAGCGAVADRVVVQNAADTFDTVCFASDSAAARAAAATLRYVRIDTGEARAFLGNRPGDLLVRKGLNTNVLILRDAPQSCELGVSGTDSAQVETGFGEVLGRLAVRGYAVMPLTSSSTPGRPRRSARVVDASGRIRIVALTSSSDPESRIRTVLLVTERPDLVRDSFAVRP